MPSAMTVNAASAKTRLRTSRRTAKRTSRETLIPQIPLRTWPSSFRKRVNSIRQRQVNVAGEFGVVRVGTTDRVIGGNDGARGYLDVAVLLLHVPLPNDTVRELVGLAPARCFFRGGHRDNG